jgi:hypothetical protein
MTSSLLRVSRRGPRATISASASSAATPPATAAATSSEALKPLPLDASLRAAETMSIVAIVEVGLINWFVFVVLERRRNWADMVAKSS